MNWLQMESKFSAFFSALKLDSLGAIVKHFTRDAALNDEVFIKRASLPTAGGALEVFFKQYRYDPPSWRFWKRASKARREFQNYHVLESLGVPVAQRVAAGEERDAIGRLQSAFIITVAVPGARTLIEFAQERPPRVDRLRLLADVARATRAMHCAKFFHHDLVWRNLLVNQDNELVLIDCPRGGIARFGRARQRLRDLASLDKSAWRFCRRTERLRFVLTYLDKQRMDDEARALIRACLDYRRTRWPDDWGGK